MLIIIYFILSFVFFTLGVYEVLTLEKRCYGDSRCREYVK